MQDESFLPNTRMPALSYRGPQGQTIPNYAQNVGASVLTGGSLRPGRNESFLPDTTMPAFSYRGAYGQPVSGPGASRIPDYSGLGEMSVGGELKIGGAETKRFSAMLGAAAGAGVAYWGIQKFNKGSKGEGAFVVVLGLALAYFAGAQQLMK